MRTALVTGGAGFIGSHLVEALCEAGWRVWSFDKEYHAPAHKNATRIVGDVRRFAEVDRAMAGVETVFHLAAEVSIPFSYRHPTEVFETNAYGTLNILVAALKHKAMVVHTSTSEVYGTAQYVPMDEKHPIGAQSPYAASKIAADQLARSFHLSYGLPVVTVRPFNVFGPRQSERAVIPKIVQGLLRSAELSLGNLYPYRDFTFVEDTVRAFLLAADRPEAVGQMVNVGTGRTIQISCLAREIARIMGREPDIRESEADKRPPASEVDRLCCDTSLAKRLLGWEPQVSFEDGLRRTIDWFRAREDILAGP